MANLGSFIVMPRLNRSSQSGDYIMTGSYVAVYSSSSTIAYLFAGAKINLSNMQAGDSIWVRVRTKLSPTGSFVTISETQYNGVQPVAQKGVRIGAMADTYGFEIDMYQSAGPFRAISTEFYDATA